MMRTPLAIALCAGPALAQFPPAGGYQLDYEKSIDLPAFTNAERVVLGEIAGDELPGALALVDGMAYGVFDPETHNAAFLIETGVNDLDIVPGVGNEPAGMILARSSGIYRYEWDASVGASPPISSALVSSLVVDRIRAADVDGIGYQDLVCSAGSVVHVLLESSGAYVSAGPFTAGGAVRDLVSVDWDNDPVSRKHVAVLVELSGGGTKVELWSQPAGSGYVLDETFFGSQGGLLAPLPATTAEPRSKVAWTTDVPGVGSYLLVIVDGGGRTNCGLLPAPSTLGSTILFDPVTNYSQVDLMTTSTQDVNARVYEHMGTIPPYPTGSPLTYAVGLSVAAGDRGAAFGDATHDLVPDMLVARASTNELVFVAGAHPHILSMESSDAWQAPEINQINDRLGVQIKIPSDLPSTMNRAQALLWRGNNGVLEPEALENRKYVIPSNQTWMSIWIDLGEAVCGTNPAIPSLDFDYYLSVRYAQVSGNGSGDQVLSATSALHAGVLVTQDPEALAIALPDCGDPTSGGVKFLPLPTLPGTGGLPPEIPAMLEGPSGP